MWNIENGRGHWRSLQDSLIPNWCWKSTKDERRKRRGKLKTGRWDLWSNRLTLAFSQVQAKEKLRPNLCKYSQIFPGNIITPILRHISLPFFSAPLSLSLTHTKKSVLRVWGPVSFWYLLLVPDYLPSTTVSQVSLTPVLPSHHLLTPSLFQLIFHAECRTQLHHFMLLYLFKDDVTKNNHYVLCVCVCVCVVFFFFC